MAGYCKVFYSRRPGLSVLNRVQTLFMLVLMSMLQRTTMNSNSCSWANAVPDRVFKSASNPNVKHKALF